MSLRLKKKYLLGLGNWLNDQALSGRASRARTRFVEDVQEELNKVEKERIALLEASADRDENGAVKKEVVDNSEHYVLSDDAKKKVADEYSDLLEEEWVVDVTDANSEQISQIKSIVLDTDYRFGPREGDSLDMTRMRIQQMNDYPFWCLAFERI